jgi:predicted dehydrogenase
MTILGLVGAGNWGGNWLRTLANMPEVELRWCCDLSPAIRQRVQRQYPQIHVTAHLEEVLRDACVQGVVLATSAPTHYSLARQALLADKHVLVEKPMTLSAAQAADLTSLAEQRGRILMVGHLLEYHPAVRYIGELIDSGYLGEVYYLYSQRLNLGTVRPDENAWWSLAPHDISVACRLLGSTPLTVQCRGQNILQKQIADVVFATLEFPGGRLAHLHVSWLDPQKTRKLVVVGARRAVIFDDTLPGYKVMVSEHSIQVQPAAEGHPRINLQAGEVHLPRLESTEPLLLEARHFVECLQTGRPPLSDGVAGAQVVAVLEQGQRSLEAGGEVMPLPALPVRYRRCA